MAFTAHCESVGWLIAICASPTTAVLPLRNVSSFHRHSRQALPIKARGMKGLRRVIINMAAGRPLSPADRDAFLRHVATVLATQPTLGDGIVARVCREVQRRFGTRRALIRTSMTDRRARSCAGPGPTIAHLLPTQRFIHATANGAPIIAPPSARANNDRDGDHDHPEHEAQATSSLPCTK